MKGKRIIIGLTITFAIVGLIWFGGWAVWTQFHLWDSMKNFEYENMLFVLMFLTVLMGSGLVLRLRKAPMQRQDVEHTLTVQDPSQNPVDLASVSKRLDELSEKVADIHMTIKFLKNVKEKNGEKP